MAGRCISTDEEAFGSLRVMPPCLVTGEAAGMAAVHAIKQTRNDVHKIDTVLLRKRLKEEGQYFYKCLEEVFYKMYLLTNAFKCCIFIVEKRI